MQGLAIEEKKKLLKTKLLEKVRLKELRNKEHKGSFLTERLRILNSRREKLDSLGLNFFEQTIDEYDGAWVRIGKKKLLMMSSYSYLGLVGSTAIADAAVESVKAYGTGTHGVRILAGTLPIHQQLEETIAGFKKTEKAIAYSSGYVANISTISTLTGPGDSVICDSYNHASIIDGCKLSGADYSFFDHNDMVGLKKRLKEAGQRGKLVIADAVFSMDGDIADLPSILELCRQFNASLMIDEAHSTGMLGERGTGIDEHFGLAPTDIDIKMGTLSKTIPAIGGFVAGSEALIGALKSNANGYIFSAALPPSVAASADAAFKMILKEPQRVEKLHKNMKRYLHGIRKLGFNTLKSETAVVPIVCDDEATTIAMSDICIQENVFALPVLYPAVPVHLPRLRTTVTSAHSDEDIDFCLSVFEKAGKITGLIH